MLTVEQLRLYSLFEGLSEAELAELAPMLGKNTFARGAYLFHPGSPALNIYLVESGLVRVFFINLRGEESTMYLYGPHSVVGLPVLQKDQVRLAGAVAQKDSVMWVISQEELLGWMWRFPRLFFNAYIDTVKVERMFGVQIQALLFLGLEGRLANLFLHLTSNNENGITDEIELPLSQTEVAGWVGAKRGPVNRTLSKMQAEGLIRLSEKKIHILDRRGLIRLVEESTINQA